MTKKVSFPEHMRRLESALTALLAECQTYDDGVCGVAVAVSDIHAARYTIRALFVDGREWEQRASEDVPEAAIRLLHNAAGTAPPPF